jgi:hypothetical protein
VRWNNDDRSAMSEFPAEGGVDGFYQAIGRWNEILTRKESEYWFQLVPGRALSTTPTPTPLPAFACFPPTRLLSLMAFF